MTETGIPRRHANPQVKSRRPCFNFSRGSCRFGIECRFVHDENAKSSRIKNTTRNNTDELLSKLIGQLGLNNKVSSSNASEISKSSTIANSIPGASLTSPSPPPVAYHAMAGPTFCSCGPPVCYYSNQSSQTHKYTGTRDTLPCAFTTGTLHDLASGAWNIDIGSSSHLNNSVNSLSENFNTFTATSPIPHSFLVSQHMGHQRLRHPGGEVLRRLISSNFISYNKEKPPVLCHACQLGKHVRLSFVSSSIVISSCFDIIHSDVWTSPILSLSEIHKKTVLNSENSETSFENSPDHLIKDCDLHERTFKQTQTHKPKGTQGSRDTRPVWNNINRVNHSNFSGNSRYPHQKRSFIPSAVLTREGLKSTARPKMTQTVPSKSTANVFYQGTARPRVPQAVLSQSTGRPYYPRMDNIRPRTLSFSPSTRSSTTRTPHRPQRPKKIMKSIWVKKESTVGSQAVLPQNVSVKGSAMINPTQTWRPKGAYLDSVNRDNGSYTLKQFEYGNPEEDLKDYAIIDSGCSGSMTGDKDKLSDFKEFKGGYVAFGNDPKGGRITGKGTIKTSCIDFEKVSYVEELKFNLLSVSQICDKKHNVLFTDKECLILSPKFKFVDEDLVILRAPRKNDVYSLDLKNIIPSGGVTCLVAKATKDEAVLWHRRLGHVNFKNINKLVKGNLVRGLPSKTFKLDHSCLACRKGKQHRASCKKIEERTVREPLELLHMDLFGPVSVESVNRKKYCLVVDSYQKKATCWDTLLAAKVLESITGKENYGDSGGKVSTYADVEDLDDQQFIVHGPSINAAQNKHSEERNAVKEVPLSSEEQALHDELVSLMHQESIAKVHNDAQRNAFEEEKRRITLGKGKESANSTLTLSTANTPSQSTDTTPTDSDDDVPKDGVFSANSFDDEIQDYEEMERLGQIIGKKSAEFNKKESLKKVPSCPTSSIAEPRKSLALADESWVEDCKKNCFNSSYKMYGYYVTYRWQEHVRGTKWVCRETRGSSMVKERFEETYANGIQDELMGDSLSFSGDSSQSKATAVSEANYVAAASCCDQWKYLVHVLLHCLSPKSTSWEQFGTNIASALVGLATNQKFNFSLMIMNGMLGHIANGKPFLILQQRMHHCEELLIYRAESSLRDTQGTAEDILQSPMIILLQKRLKTSGGDEDFWIYCLNREVREAREETISQPKDSQAKGHNSRNWPSSLIRHLKKEETLKKQFKDDDITCDISLIFSDQVALSIHGVTMEDGRVQAAGHTEDSPKDNVQQVKSNKPVADNDGNDGYFGEAWSSKPEGTRHLGSNNAHGSFGADMSPPVVESPTNDNESDMGSPKLENRKLPFKTLINEEKVESVDCVLPRAVVNVVKVLERGPWMIRKSPIILNKWSSSLSLKKGEVTKVPVWVKMHNVPLLAYSEDGLSLIATQIGKPIMLDAFTCSMCVESWGRIGFSQALIEVSSDSDLKKEVIMTIPNELPNEEGTVYVKEVIRVEYEWKPPHSPSMAANMPSLKADQEEVFVEVKGRRKKGKTSSTQHQQINGVKLSKPTPNFQYRPVPKSGKDMGDASNVGAKDQNKGATSQSSFAKTFVVEDLNLKNSFEALKDSNNIFEAQESGKQSSMWTDDLESDDEVDEVLFPEGNKFGDQFDIRLKGRVRK
ncbi:putative ribonuclease H-like domain-containing protein [Tanacetum coccineum]